MVEQSMFLIALMQQSCWQGWWLSWWQRNIWRVIFEVFLQQITCKDFSDL